jgi:hypothetical protein
MLPGVVAIQPSAPRAASLTRPTLALALPAISLALLSANPLITAAAVASLAAIVLLTWRPGEPPVVLFVSGMQWLQASIAIFHADILGEGLWTLSYAHGFETATWLSLGWVVVFALGMRLALIGARNRVLREGQWANIDPRKAFRLYLAWTVLGLAFHKVAVGGLYQVAIALDGLRWSVVFAVFWLVLRQRRDFWLLAVVFVFEFLTGFLGFFSNFKLPMYVLAIAFLAADYRMRPRQVVALAVVGAAALYLGVLWSAIKMDYRDTLNQGSGAQVVSIGYTERIESLLSLLGDADGETLEAGLDSFVARFAYTEYFAHVVDFVPAIAPHERGELHLAALRHVLMPRLLFPDKPALVPDTVLAERYTGLMLVRTGRDTSISIGIAADSYVDFGVPGMFVSALFLGLFAGFTYRWTIALRGDPLLASSLAVGLLLPLGTLELTVVKFIGGHATRLIIAVLVWKTVIPAASQLLGMRRRSANDPLRAG